MKTATKPQSHQSRRRPNTIKAMQLPTPVGELMLCADDDGLTHLVLPGAARPPQSTGVDEDDGGQEVGIHHHLLEAATQLDEYFAGERQSFELALDPQGTPFQRKVWFALADIPYGQTISYAELARRVGRPKAFRAVGQANGRNPLAIILPCHRVITSEGTIGGYGGGLPMKRELLAHEGAASFR
ncbi:MAG TPA: methylated-DNA--[protein]-cysteine S-methyltransferase [Acidimicrobiales bacterium]|jgi:methylated-DNA-[protein]-cysteine S-methyltransferase|nr:methylated-DNA--[protein]-cysteine S-methyltransferase [Acidimicrobiales bacterium]